MIVIGLAGGMGQGKSTVGAHLRQLAKVDYRADLESSYPISEVANDWVETWPQPLTLKPGQDVTALANELIKMLPPIIEARTGKKTTADHLTIGPHDGAADDHMRLIEYLQHWLALSPTERAVQLPLPIAPENKALHRVLLQFLGGSLIILVSPTIWSDILDHRIKQLAGRGYALVTVGGIRYKHDMEMIHSNGGIILLVVRPNAETSTDVTENSMSEVVADTTLVNDGTLADLDAVVGKIWADVTVGETAQQYRAGSTY